MYSYFDTVCIRFSCCDFVRVVRYPVSFTLLDNLLIQIWMILFCVATNRFIEFGKQHHLQLPQPGAKIDDFDLSVLQPGDILSHKGFVFFFNLMTVVLLTLVCMTWF